MNGACQKSSPTLFTCECYLGFSGLLCETPTDPCSSNSQLSSNFSSPCQNGTCIYDTAFENNFQCKCKPGFTGKTCAIDVNECMSSPCLNQGRCMELEGIPNEFRCVLYYL